MVAPHPLPPPLSPTPPHPLRVCSQSPFSPAVGRRLSPSSDGRDNLSSASRRSRYRRIQTPSPSLTYLPGCLPTSHQPTHPPTPPSATLRPGIVSPGLQNTHTHTNTFRAPFVPSRLLSYVLGVLDIPIAWPDVPTYTIPHRTEVDFGYLYE